VLGAAVIVAAGRARLRQVRLPGALRETTQQGRGRGKRQPVVTSRRLTWVDAALLTALAAVAVTLAWMSLTPLRASRAALRGDEALSRGDGTAAVAAYERAIALEPGVGSYRTRLGQLYAQVQRDAQAVPILDQAFRLDPSQVEAERTAASLAEGGGNVTLARRLFGAALAADPKNSKTIQQYAAFERRHGGNAVAARRLEQAVKDLPHDADLWAVLGVARLELGDRTGARAAWTRALAIQPDQPTALEELKATAAAGG
jgi:tetratricopeptide (TPR) repeat protein